MNNNLLIIGAGMYALVAKEIAQSMGCFDEIAFVDDCASAALDGTRVIGQTNDIDALSLQYPNMIVAIGNPEVRLSLIDTIAQNPQWNLVNLISPMAYVSPSAKLGRGCIVEPMAVVHTACVLANGCLVSAGAVVNHGAELSDGVHVDCNATVAGYARVPRATKVRTES